MNPQTPENTGFGTMPASEVRTVWGLTKPVDFDMTPRPSPFREPIRGLVTLERDDPELFSLFFED